MSAKAEEQTATVSDFQEWKRQYTQLLPLEDKWVKSLRDASEVKDLYTLHQMLGEKPYSDPDTLLVANIEDVVLSGVKLGAQKVCITSGGGAGVLFVEKDFGALMAGLDSLSKRPDVEMGSIQLKQDKAQAKAYVAPLCLLLRKEEGVAKK